LLPEEVYKRRRRHNNTPKSQLLIVANYLVIFVCTSLFTSCGRINNFFWYVVAALVIYNFFDVRRYRDEYNKTTIIAYVGSIIFLIIAFIFFLNREPTCPVKL